MYLVVNKIMNSNKKLNNFLIKCEKIHGDLYDYTLVEYENNKIPVKIICKKHGVFEQAPDKHINRKQGCPKCAGVERKSTPIFISEANEIHGGLFNYSGVEYINARTKVSIICEKHGVFTQNPIDHLSGQGCPKCAGVGKTTDDWVKSAKETHGDLYDYSNSKFINNKTPIKIICKKHGEFEQLPGVHLKGHGCSICSGNKKLTTNEFIILSKRYHNNLYDYTLVNYKNSQNKVEIICPTHGIFKQTPINHLNSQGCPKCSGQFMDTTLFIKKANKMHNNFYDYSLVDYKNSQNKVEIICPEHGVFQQKPGNHIQGKNCPKCSSFGPSKSEIEILEYLKSISITAETSNRTVLNGLELDIHIPSHNIAIEFDGLYWHSEVHKDKKYHLRKTELCLKKGIQLIHIFEDEWILKKDIVKSRLKNILGLTSNKIFGRKTVIKEVETKQARLFFENNHLQGYTNSKIKLGLYYKDELVSCMLFSKPRIGIGGSYDGYELTRFANLVNTNVIGGASKLLKYFEKTYQPVEIRSYADRRWSDGGLYKTLGFELGHINKPNYWYINNQKRFHRFGFRKELLKKLGFDTKNQTEHEIMLERKIYRIYDCGTLSYKKTITLM